MRTAQFETVGNNPYSINFGWKFKLYGQAFIKQVSFDSNLNPDDEVCKRQQGCIRLLVKNWFALIQRVKDWDLDRRYIQWILGLKC